LLVLLVAARASAAAPAQHALHWVRAKGAERCIDPKRLAARVEALTGPAFVVPAEAELSLEGVVEPATRGFRVRLVSTQPDGIQRGERVLTTSNSDCRQLDAAIAFVIALTIDPGLALAGVPADVLAQFAQEQPPEQALLAELAAQPAVQAGSQQDVLDIAPEAPSSPAAPAGPGEKPAGARARRRPRYEGSLAVATLGRILPGWSFGLRAALGFDHPRFLPLVLSATALPGASARAIEAGQGATFQAYDAALSLCPGLRWRDLRAHACVGPALSYLRARGSDFDRDRRASLWDPTLAFGLGLGLALGRGFGLSADASLRVRLTDQRFEFLAASGTIQLAHEPARLGLLLCLGPRYEF
jgi:hypothetical protein